MGVLFGVHIEKVERSVVIFVFVEHSHVQILAKYRGHEFEFLLACDHTNVLFLQNLFGSSLEIGPLGEHFGPGSEEMHQQIVVVQTILVSIDCVEIGFMNHVILNVNHFFTFV